MIANAIAQYLHQHGLSGFHPRAVLFDMDGTLIDSMPNHAIAWVQAMAHHGIAFTAEDSYLTEGAKGVDTIRQYVRAQQQRDISESAAMEIYQEKARIFATLPEPQLMDGVTELLTAIKQSGMSIGIVTGSAQRPLIRHIATTFAAFITEDNIISAYDVTHGKPHPEPYLKGMEKLHTAPTETIVIENAPLGITSGASSGAFTIAVNTGPLPDDLLLHAGAHLLVHALTTLTPLLRLAESTPLRG